MHNPVSREWLEKFAPAPEVVEPKKHGFTKTATRRAEFDLRDWINSSSLEIRREKSMDGGGTLWEMRCPWREGDSYAGWISQASDGVIRAGCRHDTCPAQGWSSLRDIVEPGWDDRSGGIPQRQPDPVPLEEFDEPAAETWVDSYDTVEFPIEVFPPDIQIFIRGVATSMCVHPQMVATFMLPVLAGLIGNSRELGYKDDWKEQCRIWAAVIAVPGTKKTPTLKRVVGPVLAIQRELNKTNQRDQEDWKKKTATEQKTEIPPVWKHLSVTNATTEAFACAMRDHPRGIVFWKDEITGWVTGMGQYKGGKGDDRQQWLELWSGGVPFGGIRKGDDKPYGSVANDPYASIIGGIQPDKAHVLVGKDDDGFPDRFLFCAPPAVPEMADTPSVARSITNRYDEICRKLYDLQANQVGDSSSPSRVKMTPEGRRVFVENHQRLLDQKQSADLPGGLRGYWAKFEAYHVRLALLLTLLWRAAENVPREVPEEMDEVMAENAAILLEFYKKQAIDLFGNRGKVSAQEVDRPGPRLWQKALDWMDDGHQQTTLRDLMRGPWQRVTKKDAEEALFTLAARGDLSTKIDGPNGRMTVLRRVQK